MKRVVIVGAGVVGLFCAVRLALAGARVTVLEAEGEDISVYGPGASAAAAGMLAPLGDTPSQHDGVAFASFDLWKRSHYGAAWADDVRFAGAVIASASGEAAEGLRRRATNFDRAAKALNSSRFRKRTGLHCHLEHATFVEDEGVADPPRVLMALVLQARGLGVLIEHRCDVEAVAAKSATTYEGEVFEADVVVLAAGFWGVEKLAAYAPALKHITPAKGHIVPVALSRPLTATLRTPSFYLTPRSEGVVLGASMEPGRFDRRVEQARVDELLGAAEAWLPGEVSLAGRAWAGVRPMSPDGWPMIGPSGDVLLAAGHSRNGWLLAPVTAEIITAYVFGDDIPPMWAALSPKRFQD